MVKKTLSQSNFEIFISAVSSATGSLSEIFWMLIEVKGEGLKKNSKRKVKGNMKMFSHESVWFFFPWRFAFDKWNLNVFVALTVAFKLFSLILMQYIQFTGVQSCSLLLVFLLIVKLYVLLTYFLKFKDYTNNWNRFLALLSIDSHL